MADRSKASHRGAGARLLSAGRMVRGGLSKALLTRTRRVPDQSQDRSGVAAC